MYNDVIIRKGKINSSWFSWSLSWQDSAPTEVGKSFPLDLFRIRMELYSGKSITTEKNTEKKNAPALLSNSKFFKAFYEWY